MIEKINEGIVLKKFFYEDEHIIKILTTGGNLLNLKAKGLDSLASKNARSLQIFNKVEVEYFTSPNNKRNTGRLKTAKSISEFIIIDSEKNLQYIEVIRNIISEQDHNSRLSYLILEKIINMMKINQLKFQHLLSLMIVTIRQNGYPIIIDKCSKCGSIKNIKGFELYEGGLICKNHEEGHKYKLPTETLVKLIEIHSLKNPIECRDLNFDESEIQKIKSMYKQFFENQLAINLFMLDRKMIFN